VRHAHTHTDEACRLLSAKADEADKSDDLVLIGCAQSRCIDRCIAKLHPSLINSVIELTRGESKRDATRRDTSRVALSISRYPPRRRENNSVFRAHSSASWINNGE